jgi:hypothetical protein
VLADSGEVKEAIPDLIPLRDQKKRKALAFLFSAFIGQLL